MYLPFAYLNIYIHAHTYTHAHVNAHAHARARMSARAHTHAHSCTHTRTHTYTHTHTHAHTHAYVTRYIYIYVHIFMSVYISNIHIQMTKIQTRGQCARFFFKKMRSRLCTRHMRSIREITIDERYKGTYYGLATVSGIDKIIGLFCRILSLL